MKIAIGADHAGYPLKEELILILQNEGHEVLDCGTRDAHAVDYPDFAHQVAEQVAQGLVERGVLVCGSGIGMCMAANRHKGARAAVLRDATDARLSREHNDANIACFGGRLTDAATAAHLLRLWLAMPFEGGRHEGRVAKIEL